MAKKITKPTKAPAGKPGSKPSSKPAPKLAVKAKSPAPSAKAVAAKPAAKPVPAPKGAAAKGPVAKSPAAKTPTKGNGTKAVIAKSLPPAKVGAKSAPAKVASGKTQPGKPAANAASVDGKNGRKGITIVTPKPVKRIKIKPRAPMSGVAAVPASPGGRHGHKPLIPSGPAATFIQPLGYHGGHAAADGPRHEGKSPFGKKELAHFRQILLQKRVELVRDVSSMESEALKGESGSLSSLPQHMAEQGSENYDQSLSLDLAAADRKLIKEIDAALLRIENGTYGVCELTGKPIKIERLEELPWARYSIEAARDLERRQMRL